MHTPNIANAKKEIDYTVTVDSNLTRDRIYAARLKLMRDQPFYSTIALRLEPKETDKIPTIAVDGKQLMYNKHFINALDNDEIIFVFCAEILRLVLRLMTRRNKRDPKIWHAAGSHVINLMLIRDRIGKFPDIGGLCDDRFKDMITEQVYSILEKEAKDNDQDGDGDGSGAPGNFDMSVTANENNEKGDGQGEMSIDGDGNITVEMSANDIDDLDSEMVAAMIEAAKTAAMKGAGTVPGEIQRMISELTEPRINWRTFLREVANGQVMSDYTRKKPNRRLPMAQYRFAFPTMYSEDHVEFTLGIDTSGSICQKMLNDFVSEVHGIVDSFSSFEIHIWCYDTKVYNHQVFTQDNIDDIDRYEIMGGGGTDFDANYRYMKKIDHTPTTFVNLTDGGTWDSWGDPDYCDAIFIIHDQSFIQERIKAPFGMTLYFDDFEGR